MKGMGAMFRLGTAMAWMSGENQKSGRSRTSSGEWKSSSRIGLSLEMKSGMAMQWLLNCSEMKLLDLRSETLSDILTTMLLVRALRNALSLLV